MPNNDLISRAAAIEYFMTNMVWHDADGYEVDDADEKRAIITDFVNGIPAIDAIPVEWLKAQIRSYTGDVSDIGKSARNGTIKDLIRKWQKEQEVRT